MAPVLNKFGVQVQNGYTEYTLLNNKEVRGILLFTKVKGNLNSAHQYWIRCKDFTLLQNVE